MSCEVGVHALAKGLRPNVGLQHSQHGATFFIGDAVEHLFDLGGRAWISVNRTGSDEGIDTDDLLSLFRSIVLKMPLWVPRLDGFSRHPCGKAFVEPDVVPPCGCNQIAKPLMCDLMSDGYCLSTPAENGGIVFAEQQRRIAIEN